MPQTKQAAAIQAATDITNLMAQLRAVRDAGAAFVTRYNSEGYQAVWAAMPTAAQNADGSISQTADAEPVGTNPITVGGINRSKTVLVNAVFFLEQFLGMLSNQAVIQSNYNQSMDDLAS